MPPHKIPWPAATAERLQRLSEVPRPTPLSFGGQAPKPSVAPGTTFSANNRMTTSDKPQSIMPKAIADLLGSGRYSDLIIKCGSDTYNVHKAIVCSQSDWFEAACRPDAFKEGDTGVIEIPTNSTHGEDTYKVNFENSDESVRSGPGDGSFDWDRDVENSTTIKLMIHYLYHHDYLEQATKPSFDFDGPLATNKLGNGILVDHAKMYAMGEKYQIPGLKALALAKFQRCAAWTSAGLAAAIPIVFNGTVDSDKGLREIVIKILHEYHKTFANMAEIDKCVKEIPELSYALYRKHLESSYWGTAK